MAELLKDRYEPLATLGIGATARVVKALDRQHGRLVALKIRAVGDADAREALLAETRMLLGIAPRPALPLVRKAFSAWGEIFGDEVTAAAMIDRLVHHAEILALKGDSYRLRDEDLGPAAVAD